MRYLSTISICLMLILSNNIVGQTAQDSTLTKTVEMNGKTIQITHEADEVKVKVFNQTDSTEMVKVYEGIFANGVEYETWNVEKSLDWGLGLLKKDKKKKRQRRYYADPNWEGFGWGFYTITNGVRFNDIDGVTIKAEKSNEFFINFAEMGVSLYKNRLWLSTGLGVNWKNLHFENNSYLVENNDITTFQPAPNNISLQKARLRVFSLNIPLLMEWQPQLGKFDKLYISAGVIGGFNIFSSQKIKYKDANGETTKRINGKGLSVSRLYYELIAQIGIEDFAIYAKYSPMSLFEPQKGPDVQTASVGVKLQF